MDHLCWAVDAFEALGKKRLHPDERDEFYASVHRLQDLMAAVAMRRLYPKGWF